MATSSFTLNVDFYIVEYVDIGCDISDAIILDLRNWDEVLKILHENDKKPILAVSESTKSSVPEVLTLRPYQHELVAMAIKGYNTVISAPTGSGKTIVAVRIIMDHLKRFPSAKVVFLVPTVALVEQQAKLIRRFVSKNVKVIELSGSDNNASVFGTSTLYDVAVMTPQLLLNLLKALSSSSATVFASISLLLFDECHHSNKKHPYNEIMKFYFQLKYNNWSIHAFKRAKLPQIVGLTACLGVGDSKKLSDATEYVINICANMDAQALSTVMENKESLTEWINLPADHLVEVACIHGIHEISKQIVDLMVQLETLIKPVFELLESKNLKPASCDYNMPDRKWGPEYTMWVYGWIHYAPSLIKFEYAEVLGVFLSYLEACHLALDILAHLPFGYAVKFLLDFLESKRKPNESDFEKVAFGIVQEKMETFQILALTMDSHNLIDELKKIVLQEYKNNIESRTLVFVRTCEIASLLENYFNEDTELKHFKAGRLTGVNTKRLEGGQTPIEQKEQINNFRFGRQKLMIATTVVEEGLDVAQCNLVIKYNHSTNEVGHMQRRGRGRAFQSKSILITHDAVIAKREKANILKEQLLEEVLKEIQSKGRQWFVAQVEHRMSLQYDETLRRFQEQQMQGKATFPKRIIPYSLRCIGCDKTLMTSRDLRKCGSCIVCVNESIWANLCKTSLSNAGPGSKILCSCQRTFGSLLKQQNGYLPVVSIDAFVLFCPVTQRKSNVRKWKDVFEKFFRIQEVDLNETVLISIALRKLLAAD